MRAGAQPRTPTTNANVAMATVETGVRASVGFASKTGPRKDNEDFAGALFGAELPEPRQEVIAAIADGIGGAKGGRIAAETAVRGFLDGFCDLPETMEVQRAGSKIISALNGWINTMGRQDPKLTGMGCTLTALVLRGRIAHLLHVGDTRAYRLSGDRMTCLTTDHVRQDGTGRSNTLNRALGVEPEVRLDYASQPMALHDRFLLCSDGVHGFLTDQTIADILRERSAPEDTAGALVAAALRSGSTDNCTALVLDVVALPTAGSADISAAILQLPIIPVPVRGETIDGFVLKALISDGRYTRLFGAQDEIEGGIVALKFPKPDIASVDAYRAAFIREAWVGARVHSPSVGRVIELPPGRQTCLYTVMPLYQGELLETRLSRSPAIGLEEGRNIAVALARAVAALHRAGIIHRDIKPDNVILEGGGSAEADRSWSGSRTGAGGIFAREHSRHTGLYGARNVRGRTRQRGHRHLCARRHDVSCVHRAIPLRQSRRHRSAASGSVEGFFRAAARSSRLAPSGACARDRCRSSQALSRHDRVRVRDRGRTVAPPDRNSPAAHALRARSAPSVARFGRSAGACAPSILAGALSQNAAM